MDVGSIGGLTLRLAIVAASGAAVSGWRGHRRSLALTSTTALLLSVALACLVWALLTGDYRFVYVAETTNRAESWPTRLAALWGGMDGSLLLWTWMLSIAAVAAGRAARSVDRERPTAGTVGALTAAFALVSAGVSDPFRTLGIPAIDGGGLVPILEHPAMLYHPPILYAGLVACVVPAAIALAAVQSARDIAWIELARRSALAAWVLLAIGMVAGAHWAYVELGWGGYWAWDPVENSALLPWLALTALVHVGRDRAASARSVASLAVLAAMLALLGALLTRSGVASSVHAFAEARDVGRALLAVLGVAVVASVAVLGRARPARAARRGNRALAVNAAVALAAVVVILLGTVVPVVIHLGGGGERVIGGEFFATFTAPLALMALGSLGLATRRWRGRLAVAVPLAVLTLLVLVGGGVRQPFALAAGPLAAGSAAVLLTRRPTPAVIAHLGAVVLLAGVAGSTTGASRTVVLAPRGERAVAGHVLRHEGVVVVEEDAGARVVASVGLERDGRRLATLHPEWLVLPQRGLVVPEAALRSTPLQDVLVIVRHYGDDGRLLLEVTVRPLVMWVWWGGLLIGVGGALSLLRRRPELAAFGRAAGRPLTAARGPAPVVRASAAVSEPVPAAPSPVAPAVSAAAGGGATTTPAAGPRPPTRRAPGG